MNAPNNTPGAAYDVVIVGAGMVGALLACALGDSPLKVAVLERQRPAPPPLADYDLRVSALTLAAHAMLDAVGAWPGVAQRRCAPVRAMRVWEADAEIRFDAAEIGEPYLAYIVENSVIVAALHERLPQFTNVHFLTGTDIAALSVADVAQLTLTDGRRLSARLLVAADGADSDVRRRLGIEIQRTEMTQQAIVATVRSDCAHEDIARQVFLPSGPLALLPLPDPSTCSIVWSADAPRAAELLALDEAAFALALTQAIDGQLGRIELLSRRLAFPLALAHAERYVSERVALIGDAAHTVHPLAGQGANLGLLDAAALAEVVLDAVAARRDIGAHHMLRRYERWRKGDNLAMIAATGGFKYLFGNDRSAVGRLRRVGLAAMDRLTPLKNMTIRRASGLVGDLPQLARRRAAPDVPRKI
jgi:2-polyprenylphenol 6-hydroxylase